MLSTNKLDIFNKHGAPLCQAYGCRKHTNLVKRFNGLFCPRHVIELTEIRSYKGIGTLEDEIAWREAELRLRKIRDCGHIYYLLNLYRRHLIYLCFV